MRGAGGWMGNHPETCPLRRAFRRVWERLADASASLRTAEASKKYWPMPPFPTDVGEEPRHLGAKAWGDDSMRGAWGRRHLPTRGDKPLCESPHRPPKKPRRCRGQAQPPNRG